MRRCAIAASRSRPRRRRGLGPHALCETVQAFLASAPDPVLVCDGGEFGQWAQAYCSTPVRIINGMSGPLARACATPSRPQDRGVAGGATVLVLMGMARRVFT